jgi:hypothetical protein
MNTFCFHGEIAIPKTEKRARPRRKNKFIQSIGRRLDLE